MAEVLPDFVYESHCSSDGMRITKSLRILGLAVCPTSEMRVAVLTSEGKLLVWELVAPLVCSIGLDYEHIMHV